MASELVEVVPYDPCWSVLFEKECRRIQEALHPQVVVVEHVGSTAVPGLTAKLVLDIAVGFQNCRGVESYIELLEKYGYDCRGEDSVPSRLFFRKFENGRRTHHLHLVELRGERWRHYLLFRDYLREHPETARKYARLKRELAVRFRGDRDSYTDAKTDFISSVIERARKVRS